MAIPGIVYLRFLKPIEPSEATDREHMSRIVRRRILEDILLSPRDASRQLTLSEKLECFFGLVTTFLLCSSIVYLTSQLILLTFPTLSTTHLLYGGGVLTIVVTVAVYVWAAYVQIWIHPHFAATRGSGEMSDEKKFLRKPKKN
jgi:hypothetical protein